MKYFLALLFSVFILSFFSCEKVENTLPDVVVQDSNVVINGLDYFVNATIGNSSLVMQSNVNNVGNGILRDNITPCGVGVTTRFTSYFAYVSDTTNKEWIGFGLTNCVNDTANGFSDSTYVVGSFPIEISVPDTASAFIMYMDSDSNLWSSAISANGLLAQASHSLNITEVTACYDGVAALRVRGNLSGWVYNLTGDSVLVTVNDFYTRAWSIH